MSSSVLNPISLLSAMITVSSVTLMLLVLLFGLIRKPAKVHAGLVVTIFSGAVALLSAVLFKKAAASAIWNTIKIFSSQSGDAAEIMELINNTPNFYSYITGMLSALTAPMIFGIIFVITKLFLMCFNALIAKIFHKNAPQNGLKWVVKIGVGLVNGLLIMMLITVPTISTIDILSSVSGNEDVYAMVEEMSGDSDSVAEMFTSMKKLGK
ncbi:MAG: hypothetical protein MJ137_07855, partial [Clostridia bacterium]|nr:hypothetical protein [Clostridia bacterium]